MILETALAKLEASLEATKIDKVDDMLTVVKQKPPGTYYTIDGNTVTVYTCQKESVDSYVPFYSYEQTNAQAVKEYQIVNYQMQTTYHKNGKQTCIVSDLRKSLKFQKLRSAVKTDE